MIHGAQRSAASSSTFSLLIKKKHFCAHLRRGATIFPIELLALRGSADSISRIYERSKATHIFSQTRRLTSAKSQL